MEITLDRERLETDEGTCLGDVLPDRDPVCCVAVIRHAEEESEETRRFRITTSRGDLVVEITDPDLITLMGAPDTPGRLRVHWSDRYAAAFGPFSTDLVPARKARPYGRGDIILGCGGYDPKRSYLVFSKMRHSADHGAAEDGGVIGRVVSGASLLAPLSQGDLTLTIQRLITLADRSHAFTTTATDLLLEEGMEIISHVKAVADGYREDGVETTAAHSVEHFLRAMEDGWFVVGRAASTHICDERMAETPVPHELKKPRLEGTITVRVTGSSRGCVYIYKTDTPGSPAHTVVGQVVHGIGLVKLADDHDVICIRAEPERFDLIGLSVEEALKTAAERGIALSIDTAEGDRVVVRQSPETTLEVLAVSKAEVTTEPLEEVVSIELDDHHAPQTCALFRELTGLKWHSVGKIPFYFKFEDVYLFKPPVGTAVKIIPENTPAGEVPAYTLAMTNDSRKGAGLVGVRLSDSTEFGPTSEPFDATNVIGRVIDREKIGGLKEGSTVFIREVRS